MDATALRSTIPDSVLPYPEGFYNRFKYVFWKIIYPFHNAGRDLLLTLHIIRHEGRQNWVIGKIASEQKMEDFLRYLETQGWANHFIAWRDDQEIVSIRKLESFERQYHLRIFADGEVRGHYEYTPESHPRWHMKEVSQEERREDFLRFVGDWVIPVTIETEK